MRKKPKMLGTTATCTNCGVTYKSTKGTIKCGKCLHKQIDAYNKTHEPVYKRFIM